jgi:toxin ParE1/3/4
MAFRVVLADDATADLESLFDYIREHDSPAKAMHVLGEIERVFESLAEFPDRGVQPRELSAVGKHEYREVFFKPYRIIYQVIGETVYVLLIADGRREMQALLARRLLR